jgi:DNA-binding NarL/FixJ family response regulator
VFLVVVTSPAHCWVIPAERHRVLDLSLSMPVLGGLDAARQIRETLPGIPILILTMHPSNEVVSEAQTTGVRGFVTKSETAKVLLKAVDAVLRGETFFPASDGKTMKDTV